MLVCTYCHARMRRSDNERQKDLWVFRLCKTRSSQEEISVRLLDGLDHIVDGSAAPRNKQTIVSSAALQNAIYRTGNTEFFASGCSGG